MRTFVSYLKTFVFALLVAFAGWSMCDRYLQRSAAAAAPGPQAGPVPPPVAPLTEHGVEHQTSTEARLKDLEGKVAAMASSASAPGPDFAQQALLAATPEAMAVARAAHLRDHEDAIARHWKEPEDASWASKIAASIESDLSKIGAEKGFSVVRTDCRTASCVAITEWRDYDTAQRGWMSVIHNPYQGSCGARVMLREPNDPLVPYQTTVVLLCDRTGAGTAL